MSSIEIIHDLDNTDNSPLPPKAIYAGEDWEGQPTAVFTEDELILWADATDATINLSEESGVLISGRLSLSANPNPISIGGGYWTLNPLLTTCIPSTTPTPVPVLVQATPAILKAKGAITKAMSFLQGFSDIA